MNASIYDMLIQAENSTSPDAEMKAVLSTLAHPSGWNVGSKEAVAASMALSVCFATRLLTPDQYQQFTALVETARTQLTVLRAISIEQTALFSSVRTSPIV